MSNQGKMDCGGDVLSSLPQPWAGRVRLPRSCRSSPACFRPNAPRQQALRSKSISASSKPGQMMTVEWRGKPVWIINRTKDMLDTLPKLA
jgi:ubiquinol-cytochrome c reductase iron-sulfur subunit